MYTIGMELFSYHQEELHRQAPQFLLVRPVEGSKNLSRSRTTQLGYLLRSIGLNAGYGVRVFHF